MWIPKGGPSYADVNWGSVLGIDRYQRLSNGALS